MQVEPDPKPRRRIKDPSVFRERYLRGGVCLLAGKDCEEGLSLHHLLSRGQGGDDVSANLLWLCGHGTAGHHGLAHAHDVDTRRRIGEHLAIINVRYVLGRIGATAGLEWLRREYLWGCHFCAVDEPCGIHVPLVIG